VGLNKRQTFENGLVGLKQGTYIRTME